MPNVLIGAGTTFEWHNGTVFQVVSGLQRLDHNLGEVEAIDTSHFGSTDKKRTFTPGLLDPGSIEIEGDFDPDDVAHTQMKTDYHGRTTRQCKITRTDATPSTVTFTNAFITAFRTTAVHDNKWRFTATIKVSGAITEA